MQSYPLHHAITCAGSMEQLIGICSPTQQSTLLLPPLTCTPAGNLLVLSDGRVGFIDFGIVGRVSPVTWAACEALLAAMATGEAWGLGRGVQGVCAVVRGVGRPGRWV